MGIEDPEAPVEWPSDPEETDDDWSMGPPLMLTLGRDLVKELVTMLMQRPMECRIDISQAAGSWRRPVRVKTDAELTDVLRDLLEEIRASHEPERVYPVLFWLIPLGSQEEASEIINQGRESPESLSLWNRVLHLGVVRARMTDAELYVSADCDEFPTVLECAKRAVAGWRGAVRWSAGDRGFG